MSLEQAIAESAAAYHRALLGFTRGWHEGTADPVALARMDARMTTAAPGRRLPALRHWRDGDRRTHHARP